MAAWRYEISLLVLKHISLVRVSEYFSTLEEKFRISARSCNILYKGNETANANGDSLVERKARFLTSNYGKFTAY